MKIWKYIEEKNLTKHKGQKNELKQNSYWE
jgi:hypothetical protein